MEVKYIVHRQPRDKRQYIPAHYHSYYELIYYFSGAGVTHYYPENTPHNPSRLTYIPSFMKYNRQFEFKERSCVLYQADTIHDESYYTDSEVFSVVFEASQGECDLKTLSLLDASGVIESYINHIEKEFEQKNVGYPAMINSLLTQAIITLERQYLSQKNESNELWAQMCNYIDDYFTTDINFEMLAQSTGYSLGHFRELFKQRMGVSPKTYIIRKRMDFAKSLVESTTLPMQDIAMQAGYKDYFQFSACFKKTFGASPQVYRKRRSRSENGI